MPKHKIRKSGDEVRISKGKCASELNFDIMEQTTGDNEKNLNLNCLEGFQAKTDEVSSMVDERAFDEIMMDAFEQFNSKSSRIRSNALKIICTQLQLTHCPVFLTEHFDRIVTIIGDALQSNVPSEIDASANLVSLVAIQLPVANRSMQIFYEPLKVALKNDSPRSSVRSAVCHAMGILTFLYEADSYQVFMVMKEFKDIFVSDYRCSSWPAANTRTVNYEFQVAAFETWIFLMTLLPSRLDCDERLPTFSLESVERVFTHLESPSFDLRVACAKAIALIMESGLDTDKEYLEPHLAKIIGKISPILNTWNKHASDIKSTAEVLHYLQKGIAPSREVRNGKCVLLNLHNWAVVVQYEMLCNVIGSANVVKHLSKNEQLLTKIKRTQSTKESKFSSTLKDSTTARTDYSSYKRNRSTAAPVLQQTVYDFGKITKNLELATQRSPMERTKALEEICKELHLVPRVFLADQKNVISDIILKAMKKNGNESEQLAAVRIATLTVLELGREDRFCTEISTAFSDSLKHSSTISTNASICTALAFFELVDIESANRVHFESAMSLFQRIFSGSQQHHKTSKDDCFIEQSIVLRLKALEAWGILLTLCPPKDVCSLVRSTQLVKDLTEMLLHTSNVEFRIACGQVISLIVEQGRICDRNFLKSDVPDICNAIKDVVNDRRNIGGDKRKLQNPKLREVLKYLEDGCPVSFKLRFAEEIHELKTWSTLFKYQKLSQFIGPNLATLLSQNERIRGIISIGPKPVMVPFQLQANLEYKLNSASKKKSKTKENRLNCRASRFECV